MFEYNTFKVPKTINSKHLIDAVNSKAVGGWRLVSINSNAPSYNFVVMERKIPWWKTIFKRKK